MTSFGRLKAMRENPLLAWGQRAYEEDFVRGRYLRRSSFILNTPDAIRHVLVDNYENYIRTPAGIRVLRPMLGEGLLIAEGRTWKYQRRTLAPAFTPRAVTSLVPHMVAAIDETKQRTGNPFGVNLRADAVDASDRVDLLIEKRVRVASFALAPKQEFIERLKANDVVEIDVRGKTSVCDFMVIASGTSTRHVKAIADEVVRFAKRLDCQPLGVEGENEAEWVLVDLGDVVVHVMLPRVREFYALERLWTVGDQPPHGHELEAASEAGER